MKKHYYRNEIETKVSKLKELPRKGQIEYRIYYRRKGYEDVMFLDYRLSQYIDIRNCDLYQILAEYLYEGLVPPHIRRKNVVDRSLTEQGYIEDAVNRARRIFGSREDCLSYIQSEYSSIRSYEPEEEEDIVIGTPRRVEEKPKQYINTGIYYDPYDEYDDYDY